MARGWESKSVEAQQEEAKEKSQQKRPALTPEQAARKRELELLRLSKKRVSDQLATIQDERRRSALEKALADLDQKISSVGH